MGYDALRSRKLFLKSRFSVRSGIASSLRSPRNMSESEPWFSVRCLFAHRSRVEFGDGNLYEERITLWKSKSWEEAYRLAKVEALAYAKESGSELIDTTDSFHLFDNEVGSGSEVWSLMRGSHLAPREYTDTFCCTNRDRSHDHVSSENPDGEQTVVERRPSL